MAAHLNAQRPEFEQLVEMFRTDRLKLVRNSEVRPAGAIADSRVAEYRKALRALDIEQVAVMNGDGVLLQVYSSGLFLSGERKGYLYSESPVSDVGLSLNARPRTLPPNVPAFRSILRNWYIAYEYGQ